MLREQNHTKLPNSERMRSFFVVLFVSVLISSHVCLSRLASPELV